MRRLQALLEDSWLQARDSKALRALAALAAVVTALCLSLSCVRRDSGQVLEEHVARLGSFVRVAAGREARQAVPIAYRARDLRVEPGGALAVTIEFQTTREADRFVRAWNEFDAADRPAAPLHDLGQAMAGDPRCGAEARRAALEARFRALGWTQVAVEGHDAEGRAFALRVGPEDDARRLVGGVAVGALLGLVPARHVPHSEAEHVVRIELGLANLLCGVVMILVALLATAAFVPGMLCRESLGLLLARPLGRSALLLARYLGGVLPVAAIAALAVGGPWIALGLRTGHWPPHLLLTVVTTCAQFAALYAVSVAVGTWTGSSGLAALAALGTWGLAALAAELRQLALPGWLSEAADAAWLVLPKTADLGALASELLMAPWLAPAERAMLATPHAGWTLALATTGGFTLAVLGLACWQLRRRDC